MYHIHNGLTKSKHASKSIHKCWELLTFVGQLCKSGFLRCKMFIEIKQIQFWWREFTERWRKHLQSRPMTNIV